MQFMNQARLCVRIRQKHGFTQRDLALAMGLPDTQASRQFISNIEAGKCGFPHDRIRRILPMAGAESFKRAFLQDMAAQFEEAVL